MSVSPYSWIDWDTEGTQWVIRGFTGSYRQLWRRSLGGHVLPETFSRDGLTCQEKLFQRRCTRRSPTCHTDRHHHCHSGTSLEHEESRAVPVNRSGRWSYSQRFCRLLRLSPRSRGHRYFTPLRFVQNEAIPTLRTDSSRRKTTCIIVS